MTPNPLRNGKVLQNVPVICLLLLMVLLFGCAPVVKVGPRPEPTGFVFVTPEPGTTLEALAREHLGDPALAWRIQEFNGLDGAVAGQELVIPLQPFRPGGLTAKGYQLVPVLAYHHFSKSNSRKKMVVGAKKFDSQMRYLKNHGFHAINLNQFIEYLNFGQIPEKSVILTLDDGWQSAYSIAYPIFKKYGFSAVLYIPTNSIQEKGGRLLGWDQIRKMVQDHSIDIQPHTKSHRNLTKSRPGESFASYVKAIKTEMGGAKQLISNRLGEEATSLSYPFGATNSLVMALASNEGYTTGFTVKRNSNPFFQNNFKLNRAMIYGGYNEKKFLGNLKTFERDPLEKLEPVDHLLNMSRLNYQNPVEYENKGQWRTACIAWKIHRDWLISEFNSRSPEDEGKEAEERTMKLERIKQAGQKVIELSAKLEDFANDYTRSALAASKAQVRRNLLLKALLYNPKNRDALVELKHGSDQNRMIQYSVKSGDTFKKIATSVYRDKRKAILVPIFNEQAQEDRDLKPGLVLTLPKVPRRIVVASGSTGKGACGLKKSAKSRTVLSSEFYTRAVKQFDGDQVSRASSSLKTALCLDPGNTEAKEMQGLLEGL